MSAPPDARIYVRPLPMDIREIDVEDLFSKHGEVTSVKVMQGYGFVEFRDVEGASNAIENLNGREFEGRNLVVEISRPRRPPREDGFRGDRFGDRFDRPPREPKPIATHRLTVSNLPPDASWQDLKDLARSADVDVVYTNVSQARDGSGVIDFSSKESMDRALEALDSKEVRGATIKLTEDERGPPPPRSREGGRGGFGGRGRGRGGYGRGGYGDRDRYGDRGDRGDRYGDRYGDREDRGDRYGDRGDRYGDRGGRYGDRGRGGDRHGDRRDYIDYRGRDRSQSPRREGRGGPRDFRRDDRDGDRNDRGDSRGERRSPRYSPRSPRSPRSPPPASAPSGSANRDELEPSW